MYAQAIEDCRRAYGGHGYSLASGLAGLFAEYVPTVSWLVLCHASLFQSLTYEVIPKGW